MGGIGELLLDIGTLGISANIRGKRRARRARQRQVAIQTRRAKIGQIREARIRRGVITNIAQQTGAFTSAAAGGVAGITTQLGTNLSFLDEQFRVQQQLFSAERLINRGQAIAAAADLFQTAAGR